MSTARWTPGPGVIEMPDGTRLRGRGLRRGLPEGARPTLGVYLLGREPPATDWESRWIPWPDFRLPRDRPAALATLADAHRRAGSEPVEIACGGGRGRTGTALACIAVMAGVPPDEAVAFVRRHYDAHAVETPFQRRFVRRLPPGRLASR
jgi:protein-tyrosine phosphatase